jgi:carbamoylphosphate synthase large subunit
MTKRLLIMSAGTGTSNNLIRSLKAGDPSLSTVGCHADRFILKKSLAARNHLLPPFSHSEFLDALRRVIEAERIDLLVPNTDPDVKVVSDQRAAIPCRTFLPRKAVIDLCQDKYELTAFLRSRGIPAPLTYPVTDLDEIDQLCERLAPYSRLWCRIRMGNASMGATPVKNPEQARSWIRYWEDLRGVPITAFTLSQYLPGRDYSCQSVWKNGALATMKMSERLSYLGGANNPSGVSSTPAVAKTVFEPRVIDVCSAAIRAIDGKASGVFCFDLKEDADGRPCVTEINAGRFAMITNIYDLAGKPNMATTYVGLAFAEPVEMGEPLAFAEDYYLVRDLDTLPEVFHADEFFDGIEEA